MIKLLKTIYRNGITHPINQSVREHKDINESVVYTYIGENLLHVTEVNIDSVEDYVERLRWVMEVDRRSAKVFRDIVYRVK